MDGRRVAFRTIDSFSADAFGGLPVAVVTQTEDVTEPDLGRIAQELGAATTSFLFPAKREDAWYFLRFFGPTGIESPFSIEGTVATYHALADAGIIPDEPVVRIGQETARGDRRDVEVRAHATGRLTVHVTTGPLASEAANDVDAILGRVHARASTLSSSPPLVIDGRIVASLSDVKDIVKLAPVAGFTDTVATKASSLVAYARDPRDGRVLVREFSLSAIIEERAFSARAHAAVAWHANQEAPNADVLRLTQVDARGRRSESIAENVAGGRVCIGGTARTVAMGRILMPESAPRPLVRLRVA